jgi:hypothetical protein
MSNTAFVEGLSADPFISSSLKFCSNRFSSLNVSILNTLKTLMHGEIPGNPHALRRRN